MSKVSIYLLIVERIHISQRGMPDQLKKRESISYFQNHQRTEINAEFQR